jgi:hypothetical protein
MASAEVQLLIFSGRPDPEWAVEGDSLQELVDRARTTIGREPAYPPQRGGLGYRGFIIRHQEEDALDLPRELSVFHGVVTTHPAAQGTHWRDVSGLESWLTEQARDKGYGEILAAADAQPPSDRHPD